MRVNIDAAIKSPTTIKALRKLARKEHRKSLVGDHVVLKHRGIAYLSTQRADHIKVWRPAPLPKNVVKS